MGMVNAVVPHDELETTGLEWAKIICRKSPTAQRMLKFAFNAIDDGLIGQQVFAGEATAGIHDRRSGRRPRRLPREAPAGLDPVSLLLSFPTATDLRVAPQAALSCAGDHICRGGDGQPSVREAVEPIAGVPQAGHDVADLVEPLVETREHQGARDVQIFEQLSHPCDALRSGYQTDTGDVVGTASNEVLNRCCQRATSSQHGIEHIALPPREIGRQALGHTSRHAA